MLKSNKCAISLRFAVPFAPHTLGRVSGNRCTSGHRPKSELDGKKDLPRSAKAPLSRSLAPGVHIIFYRPGVADLFRHGFGLRKQQQIIRPAGFGVCAGHVEAAERMRAHHRSCTFAIEVEIAYVKIGTCALQFLTRG